MFQDVVRQKGWGYFVHVAEEAVREYMDRERVYKAYERTHERPAVEGDGEHKRIQLRVRDTGASTKKRVPQGLVQGYRGDCFLLATQGWGVHIQEVCRSKDALELQAREGVLRASPQPKVAKERREPLRL